jgi:iron complex outermembrane receptor protein
MVKKTETPVPVDIVNVGQISTTTTNDITSILNHAAPSFNVNKQSGSDGADHIDLATLRGLGPDQTLVLLMVSVVIKLRSWRWWQVSNSGTDLSALGFLAIDRVEIYAMELLLIWF